MNTSKFLHNKHVKLCTLDGDFKNVVFYET